MNIAFLVFCSADDGHAWKKDKFTRETTETYNSDGSAQLDEYLEQMAEKESNHSTRHDEGDTSDGSQEYDTASECGLNSNQGTRSSLRTVNKRPENSVKSYSLRSRNISEEGNHLTSSEASQPQTTGTLKRNDKNSSASSSKPQKQRKDAGLAGSSCVTNGKTGTVSAQHFGVLLRNVKKLQVWNFSY